MKFFPALLFLFLSNSIFAQVEILAEQDPDRNLTLFGMNQGVIPYTIRIEFAKLQNLESPEGMILFKVATPGKSTLLKLKSIYVNKPTSFNYKTQLYKGEIRAAAPDPIAYLIPIAAGTPLSMRPLTAQTTRPAESQEYVGVGFYFENQAVICAPRKGIVTGIKMNANAPSAGPADLNSENYLEIYHSDGTFSRLTGLESNSAKVAVGETVFPGQPIADSGPLPNQSQYHVKMIQSRWEMNEKGVAWINFPVAIFTEKLEAKSDQTLSELRSAHPVALITKEMDKKELKKYTSN